MSSRPAKSRRRPAGTKKGNVTVAGHKASAAENGHRQLKGQAACHRELSVDAALHLPKRICDQGLAFDRVQELERPRSPKCW